MIFSGLVKSSTVDCPKKLCAVLFAPMCNYDCFYCHNRHLLSDAPVLNESVIDEFLRKRIGFLDAIVVSGGEPTLQKELPGFLKYLKDMGYYVKLDTNGSDPDMLCEILKDGCADYIAIDYKAPPEMYEEICGQGVSFKPVLRSIRLVMDYGVDYEVRTTAIPQISAEDTVRMAKEIDAVKTYALQIYKKPELYKETDKFRVMAKAMDADRLFKLKDEIIQYQPNTIVRA